MNQSYLDASKLVQNQTITPDSNILNIVNEAIVNNADESTLSLNTDEIDAPDNIKKIVQEEFE